MTRKGIVRLVFLALLAALVVAALIFTRPMTLEEIYPGLDWEKFEKLTIYSTQLWRADTVHKVHDQYNYNGHFTADDALTQELMELLKIQTFHS